MPAPTMARLISVKPATKTSSDFGIFNTHNPAPMNKRANPTAISPAGRSRNSPNFSNKALLDGVLLVFGAIRIITFVVMPPYSMNTLVETSLHETLDGRVQ